MEHCLRTKMLNRIEESTSRLGPILDVAIHSKKRHKVYNKRNRLVIKRRTELRESSDIGYARSSFLHHQINNFLAITNVSHREISTAIILHRNMFGNQTSSC